MNIKRILSTALTVVLIFTTLFAVIPVNAFAAYSNSSASSGAKIPEGIEEYKSKVKEVQTSNYNSRKKKYEAE